MIRTRGRPGTSLTGASDGSLFALLLWSFAGCACTQDMATNALRRNAANLRILRTYTEVVCLRQPRLHAASIGATIGNLCGRITPGHDPCSGAGGPTNRS